MDSEYISVDPSTATKYTSAMGATSKFNSNAALHERHISQDYNSRKQNFNSSGLQKQNFN